MNRSAERPAHLVLGADGVRVVSCVGALAELADAGCVWGSFAVGIPGLYPAYEPQGRMLVDAVLAA